MTRNETKAMGLKSTGLTLALGLVGLTIAGQASAGCANLLLPAPSGHAAGLTPAVYRPDGAGGAFVKVSDESFWGESIVGLWKVEFIAKGNAKIPDGTLVDFGTAIWHEDGTETMVSGGRDPTSGDVCMGVWEQVGRSSYKLIHVALAWQPATAEAPAKYLGPASIIENVILDSTGNTFHGSFKTTQYADKAAVGQEFHESTILAPTPILGEITGKRVVVD